MNTVDKIKAGDRIEFDNKQFVPMLDKEGKERIGNRGTLVKYGRVKVQARVITTREGKANVWLDTSNYDQWINKSEMLNLSIL